MKVLIAIDSFKGSLSSQKAGEAIKLGLERVYPKAETRIIPIADGGEGTVEAITNACNGKIIFEEVKSPIGEPVQASMGILPDGTAVIEMAAASGLTLVPPKKRNPLKTTTFGTGELIKKALDLGYRNIVVGIGGSATNDGGAGMAQALGVRFLDKKGQELEWGGAALARLAKIDFSNQDPRLAEAHVTVMCDVDNPLCGQRGASNVYGPQKGATPEMVDILDKSLENMALIIKEQVGLDIAELPGAGAAGGLGAGLVAFAKAELKSGVEAVLDTVNFNDLMPQTDLVVTGEGQIDKQSLYGKVLMGVTSRARHFNKPVIAVVGTIGAGAEELYQHGLSSIVSIASGPLKLEDCMSQAFNLTVDTAERIFRILKTGKELKNNDN